jgi:hypothetical protein
MVPNIASYIAVLSCNIDCSSKLQPTQTMCNFYVCSWNYWVCWQFVERPVVPKYQMPSIWLACFVQSGSQPVSQTLFTNLLANHIMNFWILQLTVYYCYGTLHKVAICSRWLQFARQSAGFDCNYICYITYMSISSILKWKTEGSFI